MPRVVHFDMLANDPAKVKDFFEKVFNWEFEKWDDPTGQMEYWLVKTGEDDEPGINGGMTKRSGSTDEGIYTIDVDNIDAYIEKVKNNGGEIISPKMPVPGVGWLVTFADSDGNKYMMMEDDASAH